MKKNISNYFTLSGLWVYDLSDYADNFTYRDRDRANKYGLLTRWMGDQWIIIGSWNGIMDYVDETSRKAGFEGMTFDNDKVYHLKEVWSGGEE